MRELRGSKPLPGGAPVRYPGEAAAARFAAAQSGIALRAPTRAALEKLAAELSIAPLALRG